MKNIYTYAVFLLLISFSICAQEKKEVTNNSEVNLTGEWTIDLRPTPEADGYFQSFLVEIVEEKTITGTFYGSQIENSLLNKNWDQLYFAFTTKDQNNEYYHSGYLLNGKLFGITYCPNRNFVAPWTGVKK